MRSFTLPGVSSAANVIWAGFGTTPVTGFGSTRPGSLDRILAKKIKILN